MTIKKATEIKERITKALCKEGFSTAFSTTIAESIILIAETCEGEKLE